MKRAEVCLTGDRPSGQLHIGHYVGSIVNRLKLQEEYETNYVMIADVQALTGHAHEPRMVHDSVLNVAIDYLACGIDPKLNTIFIQSMIPQLAEFTVLYMNYVTLARLQRNPTVKSEMQQKGFGSNVPIGFLAHPVSQAADITAFGATIVPVGEDQLPLLEQTNEIVRHINNFFETDVLKECKPVLSRVRRLPGTDGSEKMGKSLGNGIYLSDDAETVRKKVMGMFTDPNHLRVEDPGKVEGNPVFTYLDAFDPDQAALDEMKAHYQRGGLGDVKVKKHLYEVMEAVLGPIRERRKVYASDPGQIWQMLREHGERAEAVAADTLARLKAAMHLNY